MSLFRASRQFVVDRLRRSFLLGVGTGCLAIVICWMLASPRPVLQASLSSRAPAEQRLLGFSPKGRWLLVKGYRGPAGGEVLQIWDATQWRRPPVEIPLAPQEQIEVSQDDLELLIHKPVTHEATILDPVDGRLIQTLSLPEMDWRSDSAPGTSEISFPQTVTFSPHRRWLLLAKTSEYQESMCAIVERQTMEARLVIHHAEFPRFTADDQQLVVGEHDVNRPEREFGWSIWDLEQRRKVAFFPRTGSEPGGAQLCHNREILLTNVSVRPGGYHQDGGITLVDVTTTQRVMTLQNEMLPVVSVDENRFATVVHEESVVHRQREYVIRDTVSGAKVAGWTVPGEYQQLVATSSSAHPFLVLGLARQKEEASTDARRKVSPSSRGLQDHADLRSWRGQLLGKRLEIFVTSLADGSELARFPARQPRLDNIALSPTGQSVALIDETSTQQHELLVFDVPQRTPWMWLALIGLSVASATVLISEGLHRLRSAS